MSLKVLATVIVLIATVGWAAGSPLAVGAWGSGVALFVIARLRESP